MCIYIYIYICLYHMYMYIYIYIYKITNSIYIYIYIHITHVYVLCIIYIYTHISLSIYIYIHICLNDIKLIVVQTIIYFIVIQAGAELDGPWRGGGPILDYTMHCYDIRCCNMIYYTPHYTIMYYTILD